MEMDAPYSAPYSALSVHPALQDWQKQMKFCCSSQEEFISHILDIHKKHCATYVCSVIGIQSSAIETRVEIKTEKPETCSTESNDEDTSQIENTESICTIDKVGPLVDSELHIKRYECSQCGKTYKSEKTLQHHVRVAHTNPKPIKTAGRPHACPACNKRYTTKKILKVHMKVHKEFLSENPKYQSRPTSRGKDKVHSNKVVGDSNTKSANETNSRTSESHSSQDHCSEGHSSRGDSTEGHSTEGHGSECHSSQDHLSEGHCSEGHSTDCHHSEGDSTEGHGSRCDSTRGHSTRGHSSRGHSSGGHSSRGHSSRGHSSRGHSSRDHSTRGYSCTSCDSRFHSKRLLHQHEKSHVKKEGCETCGKEGSPCTTHSLVDTITISDPASPPDLETSSDVEPDDPKKAKGHRCISCPRTFATLSDLGLHALIHTAKDTTTHRYKCTQCEDKSFKFIESLRQHIRMHMGAVDYICAECGKTFLSSSSLAQHKTVHSDLRPFKCDRCDKTFKKQSTLQQHYTCHTGEGRHHYCETCGKSFLQPAALANHMRTHTGQRPYRCKLCPAAFTQSGRLGVHMKIHNNVKPHCCHVCGQCFVIRSYLVNHLRTHSGEKPFLCSLCNHAFANSFTRSRHMKTFHINPKNQNKSAGTPGTPPSSVPDPLRNPAADATDPSDHPVEQTITVTVPINTSVTNEDTGLVDNTEVGQMSHVGQPPDVNTHEMGAAIMHDDVNLNNMESLQSVLIPASQTTNMVVMATSEQINQPQTQQIQVANPNALLMAAPDNSIVTLQNPAHSLLTLDNPGSAILTIDNTDNSVLAIDTAQSDASITHYVCPICGSRFEHFSSLTDHYSLNHAENVEMLNTENSEIVQHQQMYLLLNDE